MKQLQYKRATIIMLLMAAMMMPASALRAQELVREYNREYSIDETVTVTLNNRYGNINIETWNENRVEIYVKVIVDVPERHRPERLIEMITVEFHESDKSVGATTNLDSRFSSAVRGINPKFSIEYFVKVPQGNNLDISNRYGNITLGEHSGHVNADIRYGDLLAIRLTRGNERPVNYIAVQYGNAIIEEANWLSVRSRYSKSVKIGRATAILIDSRYSTITIDEVGSVVADSQYDEININKLNNLVAESAYTRLRTGEIGSSLRLNARYGSFNAAGTSNNFERIEIDGAYCNIVLPLNQNASFRISARVEYSTLRFCEDCLTLETSRTESRAREITGFSGASARATAEVKIASRYGSVLLR